MRVEVLDLRDISTTGLFYIELQCYENDESWYFISKPLSSLIELDAELRASHSLDIALPKLETESKDHKITHRRKKQVQLYIDCILSDESIATNQKTVKFFGKNVPLPSKRLQSATSPNASRRTQSALPLLKNEEPYVLEQTALEKFIQRDYAITPANVDAIDENGRNERESVLKEIFETELKYVEFTTLLWNMYFSPLHGNNDAFASPDDEKHEIPLNAAKKMFPPNLDAIIELHTALSTILCQRYYPFLETGMYNMPIGDIFRQVSTMLDIYVPFLQYYESCSKTVRKYRTRVPAFEKWLLKRKKMPASTGLDIFSLLIMPCQRLPRYLLLLQSLLKVTCAEFHDRAEIEMAIVEIQTCIGRHNELIRVQGSKDRTFKIAKRLQIRDLAWNKRLILKEAPVTIEGIAHHAYLFYDVLIIEKKQDGKQKPVFTMNPLYHTTIANFSHNSICTRKNRIRIYVPQSDD
jgi:hypothetical protein